MAITITVGTRTAGKARFLLDMTLDAVAAGEDVLVATHTPSAFQEAILARCHERGPLVRASVEKYGVRVCRRIG